MINESSNTMIFTEGLSFISELVEPLLTKFVVAIIILLTGLILGRLLGKFIQRILREVELNNIIKKSVGIKARLEETIALFVTYFIYFIAIVMALGHLGLETYILHIISAAVLLLIVLSIFLGIKDFVPNMIAGFIIQKKGSLKQGDYIKVREVKGKIIHLNLVETRVETKSGDIIYIPNSLMSKTEVRKLKRL